MLFRSLEPSYTFAEEAVRLSDFLGNWYPSCFGQFNILIDLKYFIRLLLHQGFKLIFSGRVIMTIRISKIVTVIAILTLLMIKKECDLKEEGKWKVIERVRERT